MFNYEKSTENANKYLVLDGQQRLTSLFAAFKGTYNHKRLFIDVLSGSSEGKDPGNEYYDSQFLSAADAAILSETANGPRRHFIPVQFLITNKFRPRGRRRSQKGIGTQFRIRRD